MPNQKKTDSPKEEKDSDVIYPDQILMDGEKESTTKEREASSNETSFLKKHLYPRLVFLFAFFVNCLVAFVFFFRLVFCLLKTLFYRLHNDNANEQLSVALNGFWGFAIGALVAAWGVIYPYNRL